MRKMKLLGIILAALLGVGCVFAAVSPAVFAEEGEQEPEFRIVIPEEFPLCTEIAFDGALVRIEVTDLEGEILKDYLADHLLITAEDGSEVLQEYYHIYDRLEDAVPVVSLFEENGVLTACVEDCASGLITLYKIGGYSENFRILETESVSLSDTRRVEKIRVLQYLVDGVLDEEALTDETDAAEDEESEDETESDADSDTEADGESTEDLTDAETDDSTDTEDPEADSDSSASDEDSSEELIPESDAETDTQSEEDTDADSDSEDLPSEEIVSDEDSSPAEDTTSEEAAPSAEEVISEYEETAVTEAEIPTEPDSADPASDEIPAEE